MAEHLCIVCPLGCRLQVTAQSDGTFKVDQARCRRGREYGQREAIAPVRVLTTTLATVWGRPLAVRSAAPIARGSLVPVQRSLARMIVDHPVAAGEVVVADIDGQGTALIAASDGAPRSSWLLDRIQDEKDRA